jgi:hypothetical protein
MSMMTDKQANDPSNCPVCLWHRARWNPYIAGIGIGVLSWIVFAIVNNPIGMTTALSQVSGAGTAIVAGDEVVAGNPYWQRHKPAWNYGTLFLIGTFAGALISALVSRDFKLEVVPGVWRQRFGNASWKRLTVAFIGGVIAMYGARMADGCTSGHGISGSLQLAVSGWVFFLTMFVTALLTAWAIFGITGPQKSSRN